MVISKKNQKYLVFIITVLFLGLSFFTIKMVIDKFSFGLDDGAWDGISVANSFAGGNGSEENPYLIMTPDEFIYFKTLIEGENSSSYQDKYYKLGADINLGNHPVSSIGMIIDEEDHLFHGTLDGDGHTIRNIQNSTETIIGEESYYGLFTKLINANIKNLTISDFVITVSTENENISVSGISNEILTKEEEDTSAFDNILFKNFTLDLREAKSIEKASVFTNNLSINTTINNLYIKGEVLVKDKEKIPFIGKKEGELTNIVLDLSSYEIEEDDYYLIKDNKITYKKKELSEEELLTILNNSLENYTYSYQNKELTFSKVIVEEEPIVESKGSSPVNKAPKKKAPTRVAEHATGVDGASIYINDLDADWDYYMGLNYSYSPNQTTPTMENKNIYSESNLVKTTITYNGASDGLTGYVSLTERQSSITYFKYYDVNNNGTDNTNDDYIEIELLDSPFTARPNGKAFHGWRTSDTNVFITLDTEIYVRKAKIPVTYSGDTPSDIDVTFEAIWEEATTYTMSGRSWTQAFNNIKAKSMVQMDITKIIVANPTLPNGYYTYGGVAGFYTRYTGYDANGAYHNNERCTSLLGCTYYNSAAGTTYNENTTYYKLNRGATTVTEAILLQDGVLAYALQDDYDGKSMTGYYILATVPNGGSTAGYYTSDGENPTSATCTNSGGCSYYKMLQASDQNVANLNTTYYYMVTRDTNILVMNGTINSAWTSDMTKPFTLTSVNNGTDYRNSNNAKWNVDGGGTGNSYVKAFSDINLENLYISSGSNLSSDGITTSASADNYLYASFHNVKVGRGITGAGGDDTTFIGFLGGNNGFVDIGSASDPKRFRMIIESGVYRIGGGANGVRNTAHDVYLEATTIFGSDIDRAKKDNSKLIIGNVYSPHWAGSSYSRDGIEPVFYVTYKSGSFGTKKYSNVAGTYTGGRGYGRIYAPTVAVFEGGYFYNVIGGPEQPPEDEGKNKIFIYVKGGEIDNLNGGAGTSESAGNRIINITGGTINYSVFGGSNAYAETGGTSGILRGDSFIYIGGSAVIGNETNVNNNDTLWNAEAGSVFGNGVGNQTSSSIGSNNNAYIIIDGEAHIRRNVYGGGNYGAVGVATNESSSETKIKILNGTIDGSVYGGGNQNGGGLDTIPSHTYIDVYGGEIKGDVYGGSNVTGTIYGNSHVTIHNGTIDGSVYGGGKGGYTDDNSPGTYIAENVNVIVENGTIKGSVYGGSAYGTVNATDQTTNSSNYQTNVTINNGVITENVFGGAKGSNSFTPRVVGPITVNINGGSIGAVYGGFDASGTPSSTDIVYLNGGVIGNAYGGGRNASQNTTDIRLQGSTINGDLFGGSNLNGTIQTSNVTVTSGSVVNIYGGNNISGTTVNSNVNVTGGTISGDIYGGGNQAETTTTHVTVSNLTVHDIYGGGKSAGANTTNVTLTNVTAGNAYGGSNVSGTVGTTNIGVTGTTLTTLYGGNNQGGTANNTNVTIQTSTIPNVFGGGNDATSGTTHVNLQSGTITNLFGGGNNSGGYTTESHVNATGGSCTTIYGGGNQARTGSTDVDITTTTATDVFGGGNAAGVDNNTSLTISSTTISNNIYGGGNEGVVSGNTDVYLHNANIYGNAFAGGNGSSAIVYGNSTITIDGNSVIGTATSEAPDGGCVFGSGNAASTGNSSTRTSTAKVNIVGGKIYGNVYGGPKMAVVYGVTETNIGYQAVNNSNLTEDNIHIVGTVFGGGESNASGSDTYDWTFISVTNGIDVNIDGTNYPAHSHTFVINGSIFGSGNASSSSGDSNIYIKNLGSAEAPNKSISIQRANNLVIDSSVIELEGTTDRTNEYSDIKYSFNMIDKLVLKNNSRLLLKHNANMLKEFYSGVDVGGELTPATVNINDDTKAVTKNVDNRIYMKPGQNLNITINQAATAYGKVTGMTFFGMYQQYDNGVYHYGLYDDDVNYGDSGSASLQIVGGSYAIGLHHANHDITKDGFYSNFLDEKFTEVSTAYIDPSPIGETGYRWIIGFEAINYNFSLTASKYSSLGTYELQLIDFTDGNTDFTVIDFDASGLNSGLSLVDSTEVPRVARTETDANSIYGLSMKEETSEWTGYGTTKFLSNSTKYTGDLTNKTDVRKLPPSLMFYLYHAKNINCEGPLGTVVITLRADIPKNAIEYDIKYITVTIDLVARRFDDGGSYDASITYDKKYEMPSTTLVNITNQSQFTTYYSFLDFTDEMEDMYGHDNDNYHVLTTNTPLPENTYITMLDFAQREDRPVYYYFKVTSTVYQNSLTQLANDNEVTYRLSDFILMDSTSPNNTYDDAAANLLYYDDETGLVDEEFMFIFDFKDTTTTGNHENNTMLFELRNNEDRSIYEVLGIRQGVMVYNTYQSSNVVLDQTVTDNNPYIYYGVSQEVGYTTDVQYDETENRQSVIDTNYESSSMGMNVVLLDRNNDPVSSSLLIGTSITINNQEYFADSDGVFRIKLAGKVTNLELTPKLNATKDLPAGDYTIRYTLFASDDGLHNSSYENVDTDEYTIHVVNSNNSISVTCDDRIKIVNGETGFNLNGTKINPYTITYESELSNPNIRIEVYKRKVDDINSIEFESIPLENLFKNRLTSANNGNEHIVNIGNGTTGTVNLELQDNLISGTYRISFKLYDNNQIIDDDIKYVIVKKKTE